jgi:hypothetical protein
MRVSMTAGFHATVFVGLALVAGAGAGGRNEHALPVSAIIERARAVEVLPKGPGTLGNVSAGGHRIFR